MRSARGEKRKADRRKKKIQRERTERAAISRPKSLEMSDQQPKPHPFPHPPQQQRRRMIQIQLLSQPFPHPHPPPLCPHPPQQHRSRMIQIMLLPHPPHPDAGASHPHPQFVAAKSLMLIPPELSLHFQYMHHGMSDFHFEDEKCCSSCPAESAAERKILYGPNVSVLLPFHVV